jgi:DNA-binding transcriptional MerR regulator
MADYIPRNEAARQAGVHRNTILDWERRELLRTKRATGPSGNKVLVSVSDLARIIADRPDRPQDEDRTAVLEVELAACRERLAAVEAERAQLLAEVLSIARGRRR